MRSILRRVPRAALVLLAISLVPLPWAIGAIGAPPGPGVTNFFQVSAPQLTAGGLSNCGGPTPACSPPPVAAPTSPPPGPLGDKAIAFTSALDLIPGNDGGGDGIRGGIYVVRADGAQPRKIITYATLRRSAVAHTFQEPDDHPAISPDGRKIAWTSNRADTSQGVSDGRINWDIWVADINGENAEQLTFGTGVDTEPAWSADGSQIFWATGTDPFFGQGDLDIWRMNADGSDKTAVVDTALPEFEPDLAPDGTRVAFTRDTGGLGFRGYEVFTKNLATGAEKRLTNNNAGDHDPSWSASSLRVFVSSEKGNVKQPYGDIYRLNSVTGEVVQRTTNKLLSRGDPAVSFDSEVIAAMEPLLPVSRGPHVIDVLDINGGNLGHVGGPGLVDIHPNVGPIANSDGDAIPDYLESGSVGRPHIDVPRRARAGEPFHVRLGWTHPEAWREMDDLELLLTGKHGAIAAVRLLIGTQKLAAWDNSLGGYRRARSPGTDGSLRSGDLVLDLEHSKILDRTDHTIAVDLRLKVRRALAGRSYGLQAQANDLDGDHQGERLRRARLRIHR